MVAKHRGATNSGHSISSNRFHSWNTTGVLAIFEPNANRRITKVSTSGAVKWFPFAEGGDLLVAVLGSDKAKMGDVFYDSASRRADIEIEKWIRDKVKVTWQRTT